MSRREEVSFGQAVSEGAPVESKDRHGSPNPSYAGCRFRGARVGASVPIGTADTLPPSLADLLPADPPVSFPGYEHDPDAPPEAGNEHGYCRECALYPCGHDPCPRIGEGER